GPSIHISDFVCETIGHLKLSDYEIAINDLFPDSKLSQMGMKDGTKKPLLCASKYHNGSEHVMTYRDSNGVLRPKGIRRVLEERGLWIPGLIKKCDTCKKNKPDPTNPNCCTSCILSAQSNFASQRSRIREMLKCWRLQAFNILGQTTTM
ncbi:10811_t:CDS:2, partial [Dentiscutata erythropus]